MIKYKYESNEGIIYTMRFGDIYLNDLLTIISDVGNAFNSLNHINIIEDARGYKTLINMNDYQTIIDQIKKFSTPDKLINVAFIVDNPSDTALGVLFEMASKEIENYNFKIYSTMEAARNWINQFKY